MKEYQIGMLWIDGQLSFLEQLCIKSFLDVGQHVRLYTYGPVSNVPDGVEQRDAREILPDEEVILHKRTGSPALHSDKFRVQMLAKVPDIIWADTDAYCVKPFTTENGHLHGWLAAHEINGGVLALPSDSATLHDLIDYTNHPYRIPHWLSPKQRLPLIQRVRAGEHPHASEMPWGIWGPKALTWLLKQNNEARFSQPQEVLYPVTFRDRRAMVRANGSAQRFLTENTMSIHFYGRRMRAFIRNRFDGIPHPESMIGELVAKHGIDPHAAPLKKVTTNEELEAASQE